MNNGFTTPLFKLTQDDPLFPYLFILVLEIWLSISEMTQPLKKLELMIKN